MRGNHDNSVAAFGETFEEQYCGRETDDSCSIRLLDSCMSEPVEMLMLSHPITTQVFFAISAAIRIPN
jgi:hypothetical protein